jgi:hypothetical protein
MEIFNFRNIDVINGYIYSDKTTEQYTFNHLEFPRLYISNISKSWDIVNYLYDNCLYILVKEVKDIDPKSNFHVETV